MPLEITRKPGQKTGIRARDLMLALSSIEELNRQRPSYSKPTYLIQDIEVVVDNRTSGKDHALYEALLAIAKSAGMDQESHEIKAEVLMHYLQTDSIQRLLDALVRIASTTVVFEVRDLKRRKTLTGAAPMIQFIIESDDPIRVKAALKRAINTSSAVLHFKIPSVVRQAFLEPKAYAWLNLWSISKFQSKYTNALYQMLAIKASQEDEYRRPLEITVQELADRMGWKQPKGQAFNSALFNLRALQPALQDIDTYVREFTVKVGEPVRDMKKRGRPLKALVFNVIPTPLHLLTSTELKGKKRQRVRKYTQMEICLPDHIHPVEWLPSLEAITRVSQLQKKLNFYSNKFIAAENANRPRHLALWWRTMLDAIAQEPEMQVSENLTGLDIFADIENAYIGVDRAFSRWALDDPNSIDNLGVRPRTNFIAPSAKNRPLPDVMVLKPVFYKLLADMLRVADDLSSPFAAQLPVDDWSLTTAFENHDGVWEALRQAASLQGVDLGGLQKAMKIMAGAHPVRMRQTTKTLVNAVFAHDWTKVEKVMKAIFANREKLLHHPQTGRLGKPAQAPSIRNGYSLSLSGSDLEAMVN
jgi:hypothetical protein